MATYTDNYQLTKPTYAEQADIGVINSNMNIIDDIMHSSQVSLAPAYDQSQTYAEGDVVMYELLMYKCISPTTGVWDGSKWERTTASESGGGGSAELDILGEASGAVASFADGASAGLAKCIAEIVPKQAGSGTPSPDNVRAISGYTAVNVNVAGKNLLDNTLCIERTIYGIQRIVNNDGTITITGTSTIMGQWWNNADNLGVFFKKGTYTISCNGVELLALFRKAQIVSGTFTLSEDDYLDNVLFRTTVGETYNLRTEPMIRLATDSEEFEPYIGTTYTTPLGQTVYGGTLDVTKGELTVTKRIITENDFTMMGGGTSGGGLNYFQIPSTEPPATSGEAISNMLVQNQSGWSSTTSCFSTNTGASPNIYPVRVYASSTSLATFKTDYAGLQIVYELATPQTVQLTPQEVNSLLGQNNISADTGDIDIVYVKASAPIQPNPTGTPTATLKKLGIEGAVFEVPSGGGGSSGGINYSTTEQRTGQKWIDGKDIYQITIPNITLTSNNTQTDITALSIDNIIDYKAVYRSASADLQFLNEYNDNKDWLSTQVYLNKIRTLCVSWFVTNSFIASYTLQYTKITD